MATLSLENLWKQAKFKPNDEQRRIMAYLDSVQARLASHKGMISLRELQSATGEEFRPLFGRTLLPSVLDRVF
jgi:hypothetical protein